MKERGVTHVALNSLSFNYIKIKVMETTIKNYDGSIAVVLENKINRRYYIYSDDYKCFKNREEYINYLVEVDFSEDVANQIADYAENSVNDNFYNEISLDDIASECDLELIETAFANITSEGFDFALQSYTSLSSLPTELFEAFTNARLVNFIDIFRGCGSSVQKLTI